MSAGPVDIIMSLDGERYSKTTSANGEPLTIRFGLEKWEKRQQETLEESSIQQIKIPTNFIGFGNQTYRFLFLNSIFISLLNIETRKP